MTGSAWVIISLAVVFGSAMQSRLGFGMVLVTLPLLLLVEPAVVPGPILIAGGPLGVAVAAGDFRNANLGDVGLASVVRAVGALVGVGLLRLFTADFLVLFAGLSVLAAVAVSLTQPTVPTTRTTVSLAALLSGTFGTAVAIGGPPLALVFQSVDGPRMRGNLGLILIAGLPITLGLLAVGGFLGREELVMGVSLWPAVGVGVLIGRWIGDRFDEQLRPVVLAVASLGAIIAMARTLLT